MPDFENVDFEVASGPRKILTGNFKKQVTTVEGKGPSEKQSQQEDRLLEGSTISSKIVATMKPSWTSQRSSFRHIQWDEVLSAVTDRPADNISVSLSEMQIEKSEELT